MSIRPPGKILDIWDDMLKPFEEGNEERETIRGIRQEMTRVRVTGGIARF